MSSKQLVTLMAGALAALLLIMGLLIVMSRQRPRVGGDLANNASAAPGQRESTVPAPGASPLPPPAATPENPSPQPRVATTAVAAVSQSTSPPASPVPSRARPAGPPPDPREANISRSIEVDGGVTALVFSPDGAELASGGPQGAVRLWNAADGTQARSYSGATGIILDLAFSADGKYLAGAAQGKRLLVWDANDGDLVGSLDTETDPGTVRFLKGHVLAAAVGANIVIWEPGPHEAVRNIPTGSEINRMDVSADGTKIVVGQSKVGMIRVWDAESGKRLAEYRHHTDSRDALTFPEQSRATLMQIGAVHFLDDQQIMVGGDEVGTYLWNWRAGAVDDLAFYYEGMHYWTLAGSNVIAGEGGLQIYGRNTTGDSPSDSAQDRASRQVMLLSGNGGYDCIAASKDFIALGRGGTWQKDGTWKPGKVSRISLIKLSALEDRLVARSKQQKDRQQAAEAAAQTKASSPWGKLYAAFEKASDNASTPVR